MPAKIHLRFGDDGCLRRKRGFCLLKAPKKLWASGLGSFHRGLIERLVQKGFVSRAEAADDRRFQDVALTAAGRKIVPVLAAIADRNDAEFFSQISAEERERLVATLKKLVAVNKVSGFPVT